MTPNRVIASSDSSSVSVRPSRVKSRSSRNRRFGSASALNTGSSSNTWPMLCDHMVTCQGVLGIPSVQLRFAGGGDMLGLSDRLQDLRHAARTFWRQPAFASATVLTLALGIGATTAIFSVVNGVLLKPLPFDEPERLISLRQRAPSGVGTNQGPATYLT